MLVDTDVIIWYMRGNLKAKEILTENVPFSISVVTYMELVQGMRNQKKLRALKKALRSWGVTILPISESISMQAATFVEHFFLSHTFYLADALIAATALGNSLSLLTGNIKDFGILNELKLTKFIPADDKIE